ncbi:hypothetical protein OU789_09910 [Halocynthiibacter sp. C4]|uniref:hypothetical protein n=1 Tax=Halocynthiibacter sp. C4 TaxID=2992758 RepID=UPI00237C3A2D|nr:hypothetical protein [Halocynthiibacter sp. C4]MDE0590238.1 hypothetical protein [Halocynthiibacter sp. C4]
MRTYVAAASLAVLAACQSGVPNSGYDGYNTSDALQGSPIQTGVISDESYGGGGVSTELDSALQGQGTVSTSGSPTYQRSASPIGISDEQNFDAVTARETIESDAERLARQRAQYQEIEPTALPSRSGSTKKAVSIVAFALNTTNSVGQQIYPRSRNPSMSRFQKACGRYTSSDQAQIDFLNNGGPEKDRRGVDPDGDGFACYWDPSPFRAARGG